MVEIATDPTLQFKEHLAKKAFDEARLALDKAIYVLSNTLPDSEEEKKAEEVLNNTADTHNATYAAWIKARERFTILLTTILPPTKKICQQLLLTLSTMLFSMMTSISHKWMPIFPIPTLSFSFRI